jgi:hypothetical protein
MESPLPDKISPILREGLEQVGGNRASLDKYGLQTVRSAFTDRQSRRGVD